MEDSRLWAPLLHASLSLITRRHREAIFHRGRESSGNLAISFVEFIVSSPAEMLS